MRSFVTIVLDGFRRLLRAERGGPAGDLSDDHSTRPLVPIDEHLAQRGTRLRFDSPSRAAEATADLLTAGFHAGWTGGLEVLATIDQREIEALAALNR